jgi:hypothetical protein
VLEYVVGVRRPEQRVEEEGLENWLDLFGRKADIWSNPELPVLNAWTMASEVDGTRQQVVAERNPYYWKTDPEGSQLPYIDEVVFHYVEEDEAAVLRVTNGEIDVHGAAVGAGRNRHHRRGQECDPQWFCCYAQEWTTAIAVNVTVAP